jgi:N-acetyl-gamma-glutamyl-phosphate reductase
VAGDAPPYESVALLSNPGCYATAAILALAPLVSAGVVALDGIFVDGKSGVSGAGRKTEERLLFMEVDENLSAYRVGDHQHAPEIEQALGRVAGAPVRLTFVPHLVPVRRGLSVTAYARLAPGLASRAGDAPGSQGASLEAARASLATSYDHAELVRVVRPEEVSLAAVAHTPLALVAHRLLPERDAAIGLASLDNLLKGAASQALQNLCRMAGVPFDPDRLEPRRQDPGACT